MRESSWKAKVGCRGLLFWGRRGFSLVELLVVIGIIAVLAGILLPAISRARASAASVACMSNLRSIGYGMVMYVNSNKGNLPYGFWDGSKPDSDNTDGSGDWTTLIAAALGSEAAGDFSNVVKNQTVRKIFLCPAAPSYDLNAGSEISHYSCHPRLMPDLSAHDSGLHGTPYMTTYKLSRLDRASQVALIFDGSLSPVGTTMTASVVAWGLDNGAFWAAPPDGTCLTDDYSSDVTMSPTDSIDLTPSDGDDTHVNKDSAGDDGMGNGGNIRFRHMRNTVSNVLMADGHVESVTFRDKLHTSLLRLAINVNR